MTRKQKIIVGVLALLDVLVIGGMGWTVVSTMSAQARVTPLPPTATPTMTLIATWTPTNTPTPRPTAPPRLTNTPTLTPTPWPTYTPTPKPTPTPRPTPGPIPIIGGDFDFLMPNRIPGWKWDAYVNYRPGGEYDPQTSYAEPEFAAADDPVRQIHGTTLKVETIRYLKFRAWVHQVVTVPVGTKVYFQIKAEAFSTADGLIVKAGIDPTGADNCYGAQWGQEMIITQDNGIVTLKSPVVEVPLYQPPEATTTPTPSPTPTPMEEPLKITPTPTPEMPPLGRVTICFFAESRSPHINNAAFFDQAELIAQ